ncbi:MAG: HAD domain-containing protein [Rhodospirillaceae bacterium]
MIVFLDFDGTTHRYPCEEGSHFEFLPRIESVLRAFETVQIVIASDWRHYHALSALRQHFSADMRQRVIGVTPSLATLHTQAYGLRRREAEVFLRERALDVDAWIALDDYEGNWQPLDRRVIVCANGFYDREEELLRAALAGTA